MRACPPWGRTCCVGACARHAAVGSGGMKSSRFHHPGAEPFEAYAAATIEPLAGPTKAWCQKVRHLLAAGAVSASRSSLHQFQSSL